MMVAASAISGIKYTDSGNENAGIQLLCEELEKGIQSMKNEEVYMIEEAWEEIDEI